MLPPTILQRDQGKTRPDKGYYLLRYYKETNGTVIKTPVKPVDQYSLTIDCPWLAVDALYIHCYYSVGHISLGIKL